VWGGVFGGVWGVGGGGGVFFFFYKKNKKNTEKDNVFPGKKTAWLCRGERAGKGPK